MEFAVANGDKPLTNSGDSILHRIREELNTLTNRLEVSVFQKMRRWFRTQYLEKYTNRAITWDNVNNVNQFLPHGKAVALSRSAKK